MLYVIRTSGIEPELLDWKSNSLPLTYVRPIDKDNFSLNSFLHKNIKFIKCH